MKKAVVVCILVILLAFMWSSVVLASTNEPWTGPKKAYWAKFVKSENDILYVEADYPIIRLGGPAGYICGYYEGEQKMLDMYHLINGTWISDKGMISGAEGFVLVESNHTLYDGPPSQGIIWYLYNPGPPVDTEHYIMIGAIPHQLTVYESILVDTNWDYIKIVVKEGATEVYQEIGPTSSYSQPFSDGRLNIPLAYMGLQDGKTYTFEVYGSVDGETWWDADHPYKMTTTFSYYHTEADEVRVMGITDNKTYAYAPMVSWRKSGKYRNATLKVLLNGYQIYRGEASNGYVNLSYLSAEDKEFLKLGTGPLKENDIRVIVEQPGDDYLVGSWSFWVNNDIMDIWNDNEGQPLPGIIDWNSEESIIQQIKNTGQEAIQVVRVGFDFIPPDIMVLIVLGFTLVIALRILGR